MKKFLTIILTLLVLALPVVTFAINTNDLPTTVELSTTKGLKDAVASIVNIVLSIMGLIFFVLFVVAGFKWMTAAGNEEAIESAKNIITAAVIGLIITLLAWGISFWVLGSLQNQQFGR